MILLFYRFSYFLYGLFGKFIQQPPCDRPVVPVDKPVVDTSPAPPYRPVLQSFHIEETLVNGVGESHPALRDGNPAGIVQPVCMEFQSFPQRFALIAQQAVSFISKHIFNKAIFYRHDGYRFLSTQK